LVGPPRDARFASCITAISPSAGLGVGEPSCRITNWLTWFAGVAIEAQRRTIAMVEFLIDKTKLLDRVKGQLNARQEKALLRMFRESPGGFRGGLTAGKYSTITGTSPATTTRDLADLVAILSVFPSGQHHS
jgi:Fic family protein